MQLKPGTKITSKQNTVFLLRQATENEHTSTCVMCNQYIQKREYIFVIPYASGWPRVILGFERPMTLERLELVHPQCFSQPVTYHQGYFTGVSASHENFLKFCVVVKTQSGFVPLTDVPDLYVKFEKIFRKHFYLDSSICRNVPKVLYDDSLNMRVVDDDDDALESECNETMSDIDEVTSDVDANENDSSVEKWNLEHIFTAQEINSTNHTPVECTTESCLLLACTKYVQDGNSANIWYGCLDCQQQVSGIFVSITISWFFCLPI